MARMPDMKVDAAEKARSAWPMVPCWMGLGLFAPGFARLRPALPVSDLAFELGGIGCREASSKQGQSRWRVRPSRATAWNYTLGLCVMISVVLYYRTLWTATSIGVLGAVQCSGSLASASSRQPRRC
jgi:hypothetical protein